MAASSSKRPPARADRVTTGIEALDEVLGGGIPRGSIIFLTGLPGSGKTILAEQALFANARTSNSVLYLTTLSEPALKMLQFSRQFSFFKPDLLEKNVHYADLGSTLRDGGPAALIEHLEQLIRELRPTFIVIDSFKVLREYFNDQRGFRVFVSDFMLTLSTWEVTTILIGEYALTDVQTEPEFAIADGILHLSGSEEALKQKRFLHVIKMRGTNVFLGQHYFEIGDDGIGLFPRLTTGIPGDYPISGERVGSAVDGMTEMLRGGVYRSTGTLISGGTGTGKTLTVLGFIVDGVRKGEPCLFVTLEESASQILRSCDGLGWDLHEFVSQGLLEIMHVSPSEVDIDRHAAVIRQRADAIGARRVAIDSITAFEAGLRDTGKLQDYLWGISDYFKRNGVTLFLTTEAYSFFETGSSLERRISYISDCVILLRLVEVDQDVKRRVNVLKMRGSHHDTAIHDLKIGPDSIKIAPATT